MKKLAYILLLSFGIVNANAQVTEHLISNFKKLKSISYVTHIKTKDFFSEAVFTDTIVHKISLQPKLAFQFTGKRQEDIFNGNKLFKLNLSDSTYRLTNDFKSALHYDQSLPYLIDRLEKDIKKGAKVTQLRDSLYEGKSYFNIKVTDLDSIRDGKKVFSHTTYLIDKKTYLPHYYRNDSQGFIDGTKIHLIIFREYHFSNYKINSTDLSSLSNIILPTYFSLEKPKVKKPMLEKGMVAPNVKLLALDGKQTELTDYRNSIVLLNFTDNGCPHCVVSVEMLNKLNPKYKNQPFKIVSINAFDDHDSIVKFNNKFKVNYLTFMISKEPLANYNIEGYPTFYLINQKGEIVKGYLGFGENTEEQITKDIDTLISNGKP